MLRLIVLFLTVLWLACAGTPGAHAGPANPDACRHAAALLAYLASLPSKSDKRVVSGQYVGGSMLVPGQVSMHYENAQEGYAAYIERLHDATGKWPAIIGADYGWMGPVPRKIDYAATNAPLLAYARQGGIVTILWNARNPWTGGSVNDKSRIGPFSDLTTVGNPAHDQWIAQLDDVAQGLAEFQAAGVPVIWRPLHEMNGAWFWWGQNSREYASLWRHMFDYLTKQKHLNNLLWAWSPSRGLGRVLPAMDFYPGSDFVDIVGFDLYADQIDIPEYNQLIALGKPFGFCEYGPSRETNTTGNLDFKTLIDQIRSKYPSTSFFSVWNDYPPQHILWSMVSNKNAAELLSDPWVATRDDVPRAIMPK